MAAFAAPRDEAGVEVRQVHARQLLACALVAIGIVFGCTSNESNAQTPPLSIANETNIPVSLVVNGSTIGTIAPGGPEDPVEARLPALPWSVEIRSPSGRLLLGLTVHPGDLAVRAELSCGRLALWSGPRPSDSMWSEAPSGDCT